MIPRKHFSFLFAALFLCSTLSFVSCKKDDDDDDMDEIEEFDSPVFLSSNTNGLVTAMDQADDPLTVYSWSASGTDADGIWYDSGRDMVYQIDRTNNVVVAYGDVEDKIEAGELPAVVATSTSNFTNGREMAYGDNNLIVAQDASAGNSNVNQLVLYDVSNSDNITYEKTFLVDINLWGIFLDGDKLFAVVDNSDSIAVFNDIDNNNDGTLVVPDMYVKIDGIVRTHGIFYHESSDRMFLTDVGDAASATDGGIVVINNWTTMSASGTVDMANQLRIYGPATTLGNPVDIDFNEAQNEIYVAERKNNTFLTFAGPVNSADVAPTSSMPLDGISAVHFKK